MQQNMIKHYLNLNSRNTLWPITANVLSNLTERINESTLSLSSNSPYCTKNEPSVIERTAEKLPKSSKVVICGGGVLGASVAYHLAELGWGPNTIVLEQGR